MQYPTSGGASEEEVGVCGPLTGKEWFCLGAEVFSGWMPDDVIGDLDEDAPEVLRNLVKIAEMYLGTQQGSQDHYREKLASSETFGKLLVCFRMIQEFNSGQAKINDHLNSGSELIRSILYWKPRVETKIRHQLAVRGIGLLDEIGELFVHGWNQNIDLVL